MGGPVAPGAGECTGSGRTAASPGDAPEALRALIDRLDAEHRLDASGYERLVAGYSPELAAYAARRAVAWRRRVYGDAVYVRGLIEISSYCRNDCLYCGLRRSNRSAERYRLSPEAIAACCDRGYELGFRTFVLQGGEDVALTDEVMCGIVRRIKRAHPDCAVTLSLGERSPESYRALFEAGADRYLLRHETADPAHYALLHPAEMSWRNRMNCLHALRKIGYQVGCGFMVGSPGQTPRTLARDLAFVQEFRPEMCGIGPFVPHRATPFAAEPRGSAELTCYLLSLIRLIVPGVLLPATTALATVDDRGRERGMLAGANVVMPNLSPADVRAKYDLYDNKASFGSEAAEHLADLSARMGAIGYRVVVDRGDPAA